MLNINKLDGIAFEYSKNLKCWYVICQENGYMGTINNNFTLFSPSKYFSSVKGEKMQLFNVQEQEYLKLKLL